MINLMGGVGNQLFQYAAGRALSKFHNVELKYYFEDGYGLASRSEKISKFNIEGDLLKRDEALDYFPKRGITRRLLKYMDLPYDGKMYRESSDFTFDPHVFELPKNVLLYGCWQSPRYFESIGTELRKELEIKNPSNSYLRAVEHVRLLENPVSIHIRRGDYLNKASGFFSLPIEFYHRADQYMVSNVGVYTPVIFSDDVVWVKDHFSFLDSPFFVSDLQLQDFEELVLMSKCNHHIIANSSFSWWGAWLNPGHAKTVVAPRKWMNNENVSTNELIPNEWARL